MDVVEALQEVHDGGLAGTGGADEGDLLPGLCCQGDIGEDLLPAVIGEVDVLHLDAPAKGHKGPVCLLPGPEVGALFCLCKGTVPVLFYADQGDITACILLLLIHQRKDTARTCKGGNDAAELLRDLVDRHVEGAVKGEKRGEGADGKPGVAVDGKKAADNGAQHIARVSELRADGTHKARVHVCEIGASCKFLIELVKALCCLLLVAEHLDHLLAGHDLLNVAV